MAAAFLPLIALSSILPAARNNNNKKDECQPANCEQDCKCMYPCLGPTNCAINAPVHPRGCDDTQWALTVAGFYWNAHQEGLDFAVRSDTDNATGALVNGEFQTPNFKWQPGFKLGLNYTSNCDAWDFGVLWTWYKGKAHGNVEAEASDNALLYTLWSRNGTETFARDVTHRWDLKLNLIDLEMGRDFWNSERLALRPFIGLRIAFINQDFDLEYRGGSFSNVNDFVELDNNYKGVGIRGGLNSTWNIGCGWAIYGDMAFSILYGKFSTSQKEYTKGVTSPFSKTSITEADSSFRSSKLITDLGIGLQWGTLLCECKYGITFRLGWENHLFSNQNQLWRITRDSENNNYSPARGDLDTQGWTLNVRFDF